MNRFAYVHNSGGLAQMSPKPNTDCDYVSVQCSCDKKYHKKTTSTKKFITIAQQIFKIIRLIFEFRGHFQY